MTEKTKRKATSTSATKKRTEELQDLKHPQTPAQGTPPKPENKTEKVIALLQRPEGASLDELVSVTGWLPHTTRAALTGLKKKGHNVGSDKVDGVRRYRAGKPQ